MNYQKCLCWWLSLLRGRSFTLAMMSTGQELEPPAWSHSALGNSRQHHVTNESNDIKRAARKVLQGWECCFVLKEGLDLCWLSAKGQAGAPVSIHIGRDKLFPME